MRKPTSKTNKAKDKFTATEVGTLVEQLRSEFHIFGEDMATLKEDSKATSEMVGKNFEKITLLEIAVRNVLDKIGALTESINKLAQTKTDRVDFFTLERRVSSLESKVAALTK